MIGGDGLMAVVNDWLEHGDRFAHFTACEFAPRRADSRTREQLRRLTAIETDDDGNVEAGRAAVALASLGEWGDVVDYLLRFGLRSHRTVTDFRSEVSQLDETTVDAIAAGAANESTREGAILAIGFSGRQALLPIVKRAFVDAAQDSGVALASAHALRWLHDASEELVPKLAGMLKGPHGRPAAAALLTSGRGDAQDALVRHIMGTYDHDIALDLLSIGCVPDIVLELILRRLRDADRYTRLEMLSNFLSTRPSADTAVRLLGHTFVRDAVRELAHDEDGLVHFHGGRATLIRLLAKFDPGAAYALALAALRSPTTRRRECYPYLLVSLDHTRALSDLRDIAAAEPNMLVLAAIGRAMRRVDYKPLILDLLRSDAETHREAGCILAGRLRRTGCATLCASGRRTTTPWSCLKPRGAHCPSCMHQPCASGCWIAS